MHGPIRDNLEELLRVKATGPLSGGHESAVRHLGSCQECSAEVSEMKEQAEWLQSLRVSEDMEPGPGFYARVMQRIEENGVRSIWSVFIEGAFGTRLAYLSLALAILIGSWLITTERRDGHIGSEPVISHVTPTVKDVVGDKAHQRDVVLVNLASYSDDSQ
jgi:hypothetical protein